MHYLRNGGERLQRSWAKSFHEKQGCEVPQILLARHGEDSTQWFQINVPGADVMVRQHAQFAGGYGAAIVIDGIGREVLIEAL
jgi:hypothetical protein